MHNYVCVCACVFAGSNYGLGASGATAAAAAMTGLTSLTSLNMRCRAGDPSH